MSGWRAILLLAALLPAPSWALEYRSIAVDRTVMYDAPSLHGKKLYLASRYYPVEVIVDLESFAKVRDVAGDLAWVEKKNLAAKRMALVNVPLADVRKTPDANAALVFQAERSVALEMIENVANGWIKVRHADGALGYVRVSQVWGI
ncbi:MAG: SH3 domain-containing protein [Sulfurimicrobium sp.]|nr:SH3 domain-containing protein [Sulfurimicrobium sp.]